MRVLSVTELNRHIRNLLEQDVGVVYVEGEISNLSKPASGHFYFTLKDATAQLRCVFFRNRHGKTHHSLENGQQVQARGSLSLYEARGDYQLIVEELTEAGLGDLHRLFELLKQKLSALGLFDIARKKPIPRFPQCIGVITSASGAALQDIMTTLARRFPIAHVLVYHSDVQGKAAAPQLISAILRANVECRCDVIILARGGGSIEDLWAFNDEALAHAIVASQIPIVTGVGHETDVTIADFVADCRAPTPTAAAETVTPDQAEWIAFFSAMPMRLLLSMQRYIQHKRLLLKHEVQKIASPGRLITTHWQTLDYMQRQLNRVMQHHLVALQHRVRIIEMALSLQNPRARCAQTMQQVQQLETKLVQAMNRHLQSIRQTLHTCLATLHAVSPLATLDRGYAIVMHHDTLLCDSQRVNTGDVIAIQLAKGKLTCEVLTHETK